jgi:hypothetical protein
MLVASAPGMGPGSRASTKLIGGLFAVRVGASVFIEKNSGASAMKV